MSRLVNGHPQRYCFDFPEFEAQAVSSLRVHGSSEVCYVLEHLLKTVPFYTISGSFLSELVSPLPDCITLKDDGLYVGLRSSFAKNTRSVMTSFFEDRHIHRSFLTDNDLEPRL